MDVNNGAYSVAGCKTIMNTVVPNEERLSERLVVKLSFSNHVRIELQRNHASSTKKSALRQKQFAPISTQWSRFGTLVEYEEVLGVTGKFQSKTRSEAWALHKNPVVMIEGRAGGVSIDHITGWTK